jgi:hypothetical protein
MATSIAFGLAFATVLILLFVPALLSLYEDAREHWGRRKQARARLGEQSVN